jgi:archaellum component FlaC
MDTIKLKDFIKEVELRKNNIARERDKLRDIYDEIKDLLNSFDAGIEGLEVGIFEILNAIDTISEVV